MLTSLPRLAVQWNDGWPHTKYNPDSATYQCGDLEQVIQSSECLFTILL